jgi:hypothetical protein
VTLVVAGRAILRRFYYSVHKNSSPSEAPKTLLARCRSFDPGGHGRLTKSVVLLNGLFEPDHPLLRVTTLIYQWICRAYEKFSTLLFSYASTQFLNAQ